MTTAKPVMAQTVLEYAIYHPDGIGMKTEPQDSDTAQRTTDANRHPSVTLHIKDPQTVSPLEKPTLSATPSETLPDDTIPADHIRIRASDLSMSEEYSDANNGILFSNQTAYPVHADDYLDAAYPISHLAQTSVTVSGQSEQPAPLVLILHTHGTEAYAPEGVGSVPRSYPYRSEDLAENVVSVGAVLAETLQAAGIGVLHCTTMFDAASYNDSYTNAAAYIRKTVAEYPSISYIFDVHRDALIAADGSMLRPITKIGEEVCAQIMSVVGTDSAGAYHPDWRDNLTVAVQLQKRLNDAYTAFTRPINLRTATFNGQYASGAILLEIGAAGNSVTEARSAAYHLGVILADLILNP